MYYENSFDLKLLAYLLKQDDFTLNSQEALFILLDYIGIKYYVG